MNVGIAETLYNADTSLASSTSHFKKLTFVCFVDRDSKWGAMAWQGLHLMDMDVSQSLGLWRRVYVPGSVEVDDLRWREG